MKPSLLINKVIRRTKQKAGFYVLKDKFIHQSKKQNLIFCPFDLDKARNVLNLSSDSREKDSLKEKVKTIKKGYLHYFNEKPIKRENGVFQRHPKTQRYETLNHWSRVKINSQAQNEDIKFLWEINRLNDLDSLITHSILFHESDSLSVACQIVDHWIKENPFGRGVNWFSNMEVAIRLLRFLFLKGTMDAFDLNLQNLDSTIQKHLIHLKSDVKNTKKTMLGGNHLLIELISLSAFRILSKNENSNDMELKRQIDKQFLSDGGYFENSIGYHSYVLNALLAIQFLSMITRNESPIPGVVLKKSMDFLDTLKSPAGTVPGIGDWDDGYIFRPFLKDPKYMEDQIKFGNQLLHRNNVKIGGCHSKSWTTLPNTGIAVHKKNNGNFYFRSAPIQHGHQHLDMLSIQYIDQDGPIILDGGTFSYNHSKEFRIFFRFPISHSTLMIEDMIPLKPLRTFAWNGELESKMVIVGKDTVSGSYSISASKVLSRKVKITDQGYNITDQCENIQSGICQFIVPGFKFYDNQLVLKNKHGMEKLKIINDTTPSDIKIIDTKISENYGEIIDNVFAVKYPVKNKLITRLEFIL